MDLRAFSRVNMERNRTTFAPPHEPLALVACIAEEAGEVAEAVLGCLSLKARKAHLTKADVAKECADLVTYVDLLCTTMGFNLSEELVKRFNAVSQRAGSLLGCDSSGRAVVVKYEYTFICNTCGRTKDGLCEC